MTLLEAQNKFLEIIREIKTENDRNNLLRWIHKNWDTDNLPDDDLASKEVLDTIAAELRTKIPFDGVLPSEKINLPTCGPNSDCEANTTVHVDEFLYSDDYIDELVENGCLSRHYCADCFSKNVKLLNFISHSMSINRIQFVFKYLLPPIKEETILDVGSRLGAVLYGAYVFTSSPKIIGVEINSDFCKLQNSVIEKYRFADRIKVICNNIFNEMEVLLSADIIILNNVFEFFADADDTIALWHVLAQNITPGCVLVTIPHLDNTFEHVKVDFHWKDWVEELEPFQSNSMSFNDDDLQSHLENVKHYRVKKRMSINKKQ